MSKLRIFYAVNFIIWLVHFRNNYSLFDDIFVLDPIWAVPYINDFSYWAKLSCVINLFASACAMSFPYLRLARSVAFGSVFLFLAILTSDAGGWQRASSAVLYPLVTFLLIFIDTKRRRQHAWLNSLIVVLVAVCILASYGATSLWRIRESVLAISHGEKFLVSFYGLERLLMVYPLLLGEKGVLASWLLEHPLLMKPAIIAATVFEASSFYFVFRPHLYRAYGIALLLFHFAIAATFNIPFQEQLFLIALFLVASPFRRI